VEFEFFSEFNFIISRPEKQEGSLLPLWRFDFEKTKRLAITAMAWVPDTENSDLIVVSYGSFDFYKQGKGFLIYYRYFFDFYRYSFNPCTQTVGIGTEWSMTGHLTRSLLSLTSHEIYVF
jgi:hypothetical protein